MIYGTIISFIVGAVIIIVNIEAKIRSFKFPRKLAKHALKERISSIATDKLEFLINAGQIEGILPDNFFSGIGKISHNNGHYNAELGKYYDDKFRKIFASLNLMSGEINRLVQDTQHTQGNFDYHKTEHHTVTGIFAVLATITGLAVAFLLYKIRNNYFHQQLQKCVRTLHEMRDNYKQKTKLMKTREAYMDMMNDQVETNPSMNILHMDQAAVDRFTQRLQQMTNRNENLIYEVEDV